MARQALGCKTCPAGTQAVKAVDLEVAFDLEVEVEVEVDLQLAVELRRKAASPPRPARDTKLTPPSLLVIPPC